MAFLGNTFDATAVAPAQSYDPVTPGEYIAMITASEMKATRAGDGQYLALTFEIIEGEHQNRRLWVNLNLDNKNPKAVEIAQRELSAICHAIGVMTVSDSEELHDKPLQITVGFELDKNKQPVMDNSGKPRTEIKGFKPASGAAPAPVAAAPAVAPAAAPAKAAAPWAKR